MSCGKGLHSYTNTTGQSLYDSKLTNAATQQY